VFAPEIFAVPRGDPEPKWSAPCWADFHGRRVAHGETAERKKGGRSAKQIMDQIPIDSIDGETSVLFSEYG